MTYYKTKYNEFGKTWAILNEDNEPVFCDWRRARKWRKTVGTQRCQIKFNRVGPQKIETRQTSFENPRMLIAGDISAAFAGTICGRSLPQPRDLCMPNIEQKVRPNNSQSDTNCDLGNYFA
jgi:hypothetical protein